MNRDQGSVTIWVVGLCLMILVLGGVSIDLWRGISERRALSGMATAAATAGASGVDTDIWRHSGVVQLDERLAVNLAVASATQQPRADQLSELSIEVSPQSIEVTVMRPIRLTLLRLVGLTEMMVRATAVAEPRVSP